MLALFAVVSGAVVLALPARPMGLSAEVSAVSLASDIDHAMGVALASGQGFAIAVSDNQVRFLQKNAGSTWHTHSDPRLARVKLFSNGVRIFDQDNTEGAVFSVSPALRPDQGQALRLAFGAEGANSVLTYDGTVVKIDHGEGQ